MANKKADQLKDESIFSPEEKSVERRATSAIAAAITLPTLLGIVDTRTGFIGSGSWQSYKEHYGKLLGNLFNAAENNPMLGASSGARSYQVRINALREQLLDNIDKKGSGGSNKTPEIPNFVKEAEVLADQREASFNTSDRFNNRRFSEPSIKEKLNIKPFSSKSAFQFITGLDMGAHKQVVHVNSTLSEADLFSKFNEVFDNYTAGSEADNAAVTATMSRLEQQHKSVLNMIGHPELYDSTYSTSAYSKELSKGLKIYEQQIGDLKQRVNKLESIMTTATDPNKKAAARAQLLILSEKAGFQTNISRYVETIRSMKIRVEIQSIIRGDIPFPKAEIILDMGKYKKNYIQTFNIERFGMFVPHKGAQIHNSSLLLGAGGTSKDAVTATLAEMQDAFANVSRQLNDLTDAGLDTYQVDRQSAHRRANYSQVVGPRTGHLQDILRGFKVIDSNFQSLSGEQTPFFYKMQALAKQSFFTDSVIYGTDTPTVAFDLEFNAPSSGTKGSQMMTRDARTRIFWMNYIVKKGGSSDKIFNHFILPETWDDVSSAAREFVARAQGAEGFEQFENLTKSFEEAKGAITSGERYKTVETYGWGKQKIYSEWGATVEMAKNIYKSHDGTVAWLGHNVSNADLPILHNTVARVLKNDADKLSKNELNLLKRLHFDTSKASLAAKGLVMDTYAMSRAAFIDVDRVTSMSLDDIFNVAINEAIEHHNPSAVKDFNTDTWRHNLSAAVQKSRGRIDQTIKTYLKDLPTNLKASLTNWIRQNPDDVIRTFGAQGHHSAGFDTRTAILLKDLLHWKMETLKSKNPQLYNYITKLGNTAEAITSGRRFGWDRNINLADDSSLYDIPDHGIGEQQRGTIHSHLFAFTPSAASRGIGGLLGPENYLPFGQYTNLQKQMYQVASAKSLLPNISQREARAAGGAFPIVQRSIDQSHESSMWTTSTMRSLTALYNSEAQALAKLQTPLDNRFRTLALYLPVNNELLAQDTAIFANRHSANLVSHFPNSSAGTQITKYSKRAQQLIWAIADRVDSGSAEAFELIAKVTGGERGFKDPTVSQFLEYSGVSPEIIAMAEREQVKLPNGQIKSMGNALMKDVLQAQGDGEFVLNFRSSSTMREDILSGKTRHNVLDPDVEYMRIWDENNNDWARRKKYNVNSPVKYASILDKITFNVDQGTFVYDVTPFDTPSFAKIVDSGKLFKGNVYGTSNDLKFGKGIGLVLTAKKPNIANQIDMHMRRALTSIHLLDLPVREQQKRIRQMLMKTFDVTAEEFDAVFKLSESKVVAGQGFKNAIVQVELVDNYKLGLGGKNIMKRVFSMLDRAGVTHAELRKRFINMNQDALKGLKVKGDVKHQLGKIYDKAVSQQNKYILELESTLDVKNPEKIKTINEMKRIVRKTDVALFDVGFAVDQSELDLKQLQSSGLIDDSGKLAEGIRALPFANQVVQEFVQAEDFLDIKDPQKMAVDQSGVPIKKTYSIWQTMIIYNKGRHSPVFTDNFMRHAMSLSGRFDVNIKKMMHAHWDAAAGLQDGFMFDKGSFKTLSVEDMFNDVAIMSKLQLSNINLEGKTAEQIEQVLLNRGMDPARAEDIAMSLSDDISMDLERVGISGGLLEEDAIRKMKVFKSTHGEDFTRFKLFSKTNEEMIKQLANSQGASGKDLLGLIDGLKLQTRALLGGEIRRHLRERAAGNFAERELLEFAFKQFPGSFNESMDAITMPTLSTSHPVFLKDQGKFMIVKESAALTQMETIITEFNDELYRTIGDGITPSNMRKVKDLHANMMARLAPEVITGIYGGIASASWKMNQLYGRGHQYAKAVDSVLLGKNVLGGILGKMKVDKFAPGGGTWQSYLNTTVTGTSDPVVDALGVLKSKLSNSTLDATIKERAKALGMSELRFLASKHGLHLAEAKENLSGAQSKLKSLIAATKKITIKDVLMGITTGGNDKIGSLAQGGYLSASGLGFGENFITSSQLAYSITNGDPYQMISELNQMDAQDWVKKLTGRGHLTDLLARSPMFENTLGFNASNTYVWHDRLFTDMGYRKNELTKFVAMNGIELELMRGDYDGDLVQRYLVSTGVTSKENAKMYMEEKMRLLEKVRIRGMEKGYNANIFRGLDYNAIEDLKNLDLSGNDWDHPRALIKQITGDDVQNLLTKQLDDIVNESSLNYADDTLKSRGLTYMVQQLLTGQIGEQQKNWDLLFDGVKPGIKTDVVDHLSDELNNAMKDEKRLSELLDNIGYQQRGGESLQDTARRAVTEANDAWRILNSRSDFKVFDMGNKVWKETQGLKKIDLVNTWMELFTHEVPIEKGKTAGGLTQIADAVSTKYRFHKGALGISSTEGFMVAQQIYEGLGVTGAQARHLYIDPDSDIFDSKKLLQEAREQSGLIKDEFHISVQAAMHLQHLNRVMIGSGMKGGNMTSFLASRKPKNAIYGAVLESLGPNNQNFIGNELSNLFSSFERSAISSAGDMSGMLSSALENSFDSATLTKRAGLETMNKFTRGLVEGLKHARWTKRAAVGMMAFSILDPNTNSILLPDQRGQGEEYDIPSLAELSRGYRREDVKVRHTAPHLLDKLISAAGLPSNYGTPGRINRYIPPAPSQTMTYRTNRRKDSPADLHELTRQLGGMIRN